MCQVAKDPGLRRTQRRTTVFVCLSLVGYMLCSQGALRLPHNPAGFCLAALAGAFFFAELVACGLLVYRRFDEFQRVLLLRSFLWATVVTMGMTMTWGFVELHMRGEAHHLPALAVPAILILATTAAKVLIFRQHRSVRD